MLLYLFVSCFCWAAKSCLLTCKIGHSELTLATAANVHCMHDVFAAAAFFSDVLAKKQKQQAISLGFMG